MSKVGIKVPYLVTWPVRTEEDGTAAFVPLSARMDRSISASRAILQAKVPWQGRFHGMFHAPEDHCASYNFMRC